ncbi:MAG: hypothetical protein PHO10_09565 [Gemmiger sp.]|nr:hypothetical protein [Gemmiger sp.]
MRENTLKLWVNQQRSADNHRDDFDRALAAACADLRRERLAALGPTPRPPARPRRMVLVAAAIALLCAAAAYAGWPKQRLEYRDGALYNMVQNAPATAAPGQMNFTYLPAGYTLEWLDDEPEGQHYWARIAYRKKAAQLISGRPTTMLGSFTVRQTPLEPLVERYVNPDGTPLTQEEVQNIQENIVIKASVQEIQPEDLEWKKVVQWVTADAMYQFGFAYTEADVVGYDYHIQADEPVDARNAEILKILQGITS